jgi:hypothetical protein
MKLTALKRAVLLAATLPLMLAGCGSIRVEAGTPFDPDKLESDLRPGISTQADVEAKLGKPYGKGGALLPFHDKPRLTWTYFHEVGNVDMGKGDMLDDRVYLFVFFAGDKFDSYLWFTSSLTPVKK